MGDLKTGIKINVSTNLDASIFPSRIGPRINYLQMVGTRHIHAVNFDYLITGTKSTILSYQTFREDFLDNNTSLKKETKIVILVDPLTLSFEI